MYENGYPPGMYAPPPPGMFGATMGLLGADPGFTNQQMAMQAGAQATAAQGLGFMTNTVPAALGGAAMLGGTFLAPMLQHGASSASMRALGGFMNYMDPVSLAMGAGGRGMALGQAMGFGRMGALAVGGLSTAGVGALAYGGYKLGSHMLGSIAAGGQSVALGQSMANQLGPSIAPMQNMTNMGGQFGSMLRDMSNSYGIEEKDLSRYAQELNSQKIFQTTKDAKEFQSKFQEVMKAVKEIARATQTTVDDAVKMFGDLRNQGFYTTADIKAQATATKAREMATGLSYGTLEAVGGAGAQTSRAYGMRGRFGSRLAQREVSGVAMGVRSGAMSEEEVMEMGGVEAAGMRLAQAQMGFLGTSRGRAVIAATMGAGGAPDAERLKRLMGGMSLEDLVTTAAGRGLGVLQQAGTRESKEAMMPYAGMAMVQVAAAQQQQLYGNVTERGMINMLGTMGLNRQEAKLMLQQTMQMPEQMRQEAAAGRTAASQAAYAEAQKEGALFGRRGRFSRTGVGRTFYQATDELENMGADLFERTSSAYVRAAETVMGGERYTYGGAGEDRMVRRAAARAAGGENIYGNIRRGSVQGGWIGAENDVEVAARDLQSMRAPTQNAVSRGLDTFLKATYLREGGDPYEESMRGVASGEAVNTRYGLVTRRDIEARAKGIESGDTKQFGGNLDAKSAANIQAGLRNRIASGEMGKMASALASEKGISEKEAMLFLVARASGDTTLRMDASGKQTGISTYEQFKSLSIQERSQLEQMTSKLGESMGEGDARERERFLSTVGKSKTTSADGRLMDLQAMRGGIKDDISNAFKSLGRLGGKTAELQRELSQNKEAQAAFSEYQRALKSGDATAIEEARANLQKNISTESYESIKGMDERLLTTGTLGQLGEKFENLAYAERQTRMVSSGESKRLGKYLEGAGGTADQGIRDTLTRIQRSGQEGRFGARSREIGKLVSGFGTDLSQEERDILAMLGSGGTEIGQIMSGLLGKDKASELGRLKASGKVSEGQLKAIEDAAASGDAGKIYAALDAAGINVDTIQGTAKEETVGGQIQTVADSVTQMTQIVDEFVSRMKRTKMGQEMGLDAPPSEGKESV